MDELHLAPREIADRIRALIAREDGGDVSAAARRLGVPAGTVADLERALTHGGRVGGAQALDLLAGTVRQYQTDACWLLTGREQSELSALPPLVRLRVAAILGQIADRIMREYRQSARTPPPELPLALELVPQEAPPATA